MNFLGNILNKNKVAIITENDEKITYTKLISLIENFSKNIKARFLVFIVCGNNLESIVSYLGFIKSNCVTTLIDEKIHNTLFLKLVSTYNPNFIFLNKKKIKNLEGYKIKYIFFNYKLFEKKQKKIIKLDKDLMLLVSTSGSTGSSKFVRQTYSNLSHNTDSISKYLKISKKDNAITTLPMSYVYGLSVINTHLKKGATITLNNSSVVEKIFWDKLYKHKVTNFAGVPYTYEILERIDLKKFNLRYLKYTTQAGGKVNLKISEKIINMYKKMKLKLYFMYGAAEATARMSYLPWKDIKNKIGSIGLPIPGGSLWIENEKGIKINSNNKNGEIIFSGPNVCHGYAKNINDLSKGDENNSVLKTGDIGYKDKDGFFYIVGRKDRYVKIYGQRVNLSEVEDITHNIGIQSMCFEEGNNKISVFIKRNNDKKKLIKHLTAVINLHPSSYLIKTVEKFPMNYNYKVSYNKKELLNK